MTPNALFRPRQAERERLVRLRQLCDWLKAPFADDQQCLRGLIAVLDCVQRMQVRAIRPRDVWRLERQGLSWGNWLAFRENLRKDVSGYLARLRLSALVSPLKPNERKHRIGKLVLASEKKSFLFQVRPWLDVVLGKNQQLYFELRVAVFPEELRDPEQLQERLRSYLLDTVFADMVGLHVEAIGRCQECQNVFVKRRREERDFCSPSCRSRWDYRERTGERMGKISPIVQSVAALISPPPPPGAPLRFSNPTVCCVCKKKPPKTVRPVGSPRRQPYCGDCAAAFDQVVSSLEEAQSLLFKLLVLPKKRGEKWAT